MNRAILAVASASALVALAGCGSHSSASISTSAPPASTAAAAPKATGPVQSGSVAIRYDGIAIKPTNITVRVGSKVTWTNYDDTPHNVTTQGSGPATFTSNDFGKNGTYSATVNQPGVIHYLCTIHPASMAGVVTVVK